MPPSPRGLETLPHELQASVQSYLNNPDVKNLRLASRTCSESFHLRPKRVYLSANSRNIQVLRAIADHPTYRFDVQELVWDDARLMRRPTKELKWGYFDSDNESCISAWNENDCPSWFEVACQRSIEHMQCNTGHNGQLSERLRKRDRLQAAWDFGKCWTYYQELLADEDQVMNTGADIDALHHALERFPALHRIILTPAAHGLLYCPVYPTPMIRNLPDEFLYPIPRTWPNNFQGDDMFPEVMARNDHDSTNHSHPVPCVECSYDGQHHEYRQLWRGYSIILQSLAENENKVSEFIIDTHGVDTGVNCFSLSEDCPEQADFANLCAKEGLRRLDLAIFLNGAQCCAFAPLRSGKLYSALSSAKDMQHFHLSTDLEMDGSGCMAQLQPEYENMDEHFVPLLSVIPVDAWSSLQVLCLAKFLVLTSDLVSFLGKLPRSVQSVELNFLLFLQQGTYKKLLDQMQKQLDWRHRSPDAQPDVSVTVALPLYRRNDTGAVTVNGPVNKFLYHDGLNPFTDSRETSENYARFDIGAVQWDSFDPDQCRPFVRDDRQNDPEFYAYMDWDKIS